MSDRNNPIKFGPEWLRNMSGEAPRTTGRGSGNSQNNNSSSGSAMATSSSGGTGGSASSTRFTTAASSSNTSVSKVHLAKLRYGREEMLALFDRNSEAPSELKVIDTLYQPRGKQPVALNNTFEDDMREKLRGPPPLGTMSSTDRFGAGRGVGRGAVNEGRGRSRSSYTRTTPPAGRGGNHYAPKVGAPRMPYSGGPDDDSSTVRLWTNSNLNSNNRNSGDQTDWATKMFRSKRQGSNTNWRQPQSRDDAEEWRSSEPGRSRQPEKWERDWGDRLTGEKPQTWSTNRRTWVGGDTQNTEENLPEWAAENADCGGTFDSSGAFHGYSNDDTSLPKHQDPLYSLTRSHTHGSFPRSKAVEEGSEEWWASEKAKKLSPKRFDASDMKFKKQSGIGIADIGNNTSTNNKAPSNKEETPEENPEKFEPSPATAESAEENSGTQRDDKYNKQNMYKAKFAESKTFDALMRSHVNVDEETDERGNFQSVIIASNNSLRQKHQHIGMAQEGPKKQSRINIKNTPDINHGAHKSPEDLLADNVFGLTLDDQEILTNPLSNSGMSSDLASTSSTLTQNQNMNMKMNLSNSTLPNLTGRTMNMQALKQNMQMSVQPGHSMPGIQQSGMSSTQMQKVSGLQMQSGGLQNPGMSSSVLQSQGMGNTNMGTVNLQTQGLPPGGMQNPAMPTNMQVSRVQTPGMQPGMQSGMQSVGITNSALNASLGLPIVPGSNIGLPLQGVSQVMPNANNMSASGMGMMGSNAMQAPRNISGFPSNNGLPGNNVGNNSLFLGHNSNNPSMSVSNSMPMSNTGGQNNMFSLHELQNSGSQASFGNSIYSNNGPNLADQWYYEDPEGNIQGPFSSKDMYNWYRAGFFSPSLMVRRACETMMRPLGSYGHVVPFFQMDMLPGLTMPGGYESVSQTGHENILNPQPSLGLDVMNVHNMNMSSNISMDTLQLGYMANQSYGQPQHMVDNLWGQPSGSTDLMWLQQSLPRPATQRVNKPLYFWDQPSGVPSNSLLSDDIAKEMKTEDQILAQLRASQNIGQPGLQFIGDAQPATPTAASMPDDCYSPMQNTTPNLEELQKLIQKDTLTGNANVKVNEPEDIQTNNDKVTKVEQNTSEPSVTTKPANKSIPEVKSTKQIKDTEKANKNKDNTKNKTKKSKEEKKDEVAEVKIKEEEVAKPEKRSQESSPSKNKKEEKSSKKELEREKKEWLKEGFTIVKGSEKNAASKDSKKKAEEARATEEAERKRKEFEKLAAEEDKKKKQAETAKKQQEQQQQNLMQQASDSVIKKAPWSAMATQGTQATNRDRPTLAEIQRLEREKKLEQMKEQQQMMHLIAQQQAAAYARDQEVQAGLAWAKRMANNMATPGLSLAEIQAEARKHAAATSAAAAAQALEETQAANVNTTTTTNHVPWGNAQNGVGGFWESLLDQSPKQVKQDTPKQVEPTKPKKKPTVTLVVKKEVSPAVEFDNWCTAALTSWASKIDAPTFVGFLKDIESPYEIKDYVKVYLGESKESNDFARQFLEKRSKLLRVGTVTPSDDLCSPAIAVTPRSGDFQEVKGKGKKTKKNKMLKIDARILGFSVTAAEDRINVGDIDTV